MSLRKLIKSRGWFLDDDAFIKLYYLTLHHISKKWKRPIQNWKAVLNWFYAMSIINYANQFSRKLS